MYNGNPQGTSMSAVEYIDMLNELSRNYESEAFAQHQSDYYGEFYDYNPEDSYYGGGQMEQIPNNSGGESRSSMSRQEIAMGNGGDTNLTSQSPPIARWIPGSRPRL